MSGKQGSCWGGAFWTVTCYSCETVGHIYFHCWKTCWIHWLYLHCTTNHRGGEDSVMYFEIWYWKNCCGPWFFTTHSQPFGKGRSWRSHNSDQVQKARQLLRRSVLNYGIALAKPCACCRQYSYIFQLQQSVLTFSNNISQIPLKEECLETELAVGRHRLYVFSWHRLYVFSCLTPGHLHLQCF